MNKENKKKLVSIIITSYNEEKNIGNVINECKKLSKLFPIEVIVVDAASRDKTIKEAGKAGADRIIGFPFKRGKGADFWSAAVASNGEYIVQIDADLQFQPFEIPNFIQELKNGSDVVTGTRFEGGDVEKGSISKTNYIGNKIVSLIASIGAGRKISDVMAGFKAFKRKALLALDLRERHFEYEAETVVKAVRMGMKFKEIPITYKKRIGGKSGIKAFRDGIMVSLAVIKAYLYSKKHSYRRQE